MGEGDEIPDGDNHDTNQEVNQYQIEQQQDNKQISQESRSYQINRDGQIYHVNEEMKQYKINQGGDNNYQIKKETKTTTTIENNNVNSPNYPNYPNNNLSQVKGRSSQIKTSIKKNTLFFVICPFSLDFGRGKYFIFIKLVSHSIKFGKACNNIISP